MSVFLHPYVRISCSQLCVRVSVCHIQVYYTSLSYISTTVCRSTCLCVCLFSCKYITRTVVCPSVCYIRAPSSQYMSVCLAVHSSKFRQCLSLSVSSVLCLSHLYALCSLHTCPNVCLSVLCPTHIFCLDFFASICCYIIRIAMCPSTYLSHSYTQCLPCVSVSLSPSPSDFTSLCRCSMCTIVFVCLVTLMSYTCFHINSSHQLTELCRHACQSDFSSTWLSICLSLFFSPV